MVYLDHASTTYITKAVLDEAMPFLTYNFGNPSSAHRMGVVAKNAITTARKRCAKAINAEPEQIIFTSGATESNNLVIGQEVIISSEYEHPSMRAGFTADNIQFEINRLRRAGAKDAIVSHQFVNNEIGTIFNVKKYAEVAHENGCLFHTDATQAFSHVPVDVKDINCDFLSLSGHKFHAPKGVGLLYIKHPEIFKSPIIGGGQEKGLRSGTENVFGIVAMGKAMELYNYRDTIAKHYADLKTALLTRLSQTCPVEYRLNEIEGLPTVDNIVNISFKGINAEGLVSLLDFDGFMVSQGSACHSGSLEPSKVLKEIGVPDDYIHGAIRVSFGLNNTYTEVYQFVECLVKHLAVLSKINTKEKLI